MKPSGAGRFGEAYVADLRATHGPVEWFFVERRPGVDVRALNQRAKAVWRRCL